MAFINWLLTKNKVQAILVWISVLACIQTKRPGVIWVAALLPAFALALLTNRWRNIALLASLIGISLWFYLDGISINIPIMGKLTITPQLISIPQFGNFDIAYHQVGRSFKVNSLIWSNWHIFGWLIFIIFIPVFIRNVGIPLLLVPSILLLTGFLFIIVVFFLTSYCNTALDNTTINRAAIHILPAFMYFLLFSFKYRQY